MNQYNAPNMNYLAPGPSYAQLLQTGVVRPGTCSSVPPLMDGSHSDATLPPGYKPGLKCCGVLHLRRLLGMEEYLFICIDNVLYWLVGQQINVGKKTSRTINRGNYQ